MKSFQVLFESEIHKWIVIYPGKEQSKGLIATNEYVIQVGKETMLIDPGGAKIFPSVLSSLVNQIKLDELSFVFSSHQDPDTISSLALWLEVSPKIKCYISWLWKNFVSHCGGQEDTFIELPDKGKMIKLGSLVLDVVPAHHMHSAGNFHLYDRSAKILYTGDTGAALLPDNKNYLFVENFAEHTQYMEAFHKRWFGSNTSKNDWCERVSAMEIEMLCPQHGAILVADDVKRFIDWLYKLNVGELQG